MKKRILSLVCAVAMLAVMLCGCGGDKQQAGSTAANSTVAASSGATAVDSDVSIIGAEIKDYSIVVADEASDDFKMSVAQFRTRINKALGGQPATVFDKQSEAANISANAKEIVVGNSRRPSARKLANYLRTDDYLIACFDGRIYIVGGSEAATLKGVEAFEEKYVNKAEKKIEIKGGTCDIEKNADKVYPINTVRFGEDNIRSYNIVIPENADLSTKAAAEQFSAWFLANAGFSLNVVTDATPETELEILVGNTNRAASKSDLKPNASKLEYVLYMNGKKIVALGDSFMVGGGLGAITAMIDCKGSEQDYNLAIPSDAKIETFKFKEAKNAILMIGDGMGFNQIEMSLPEINGKFIGADLPNKGQSKTDSVYGSTTDSAAGGTALSTGYKTANGKIGKDKNSKDLLNVRELAHSLGAKTAVITNDDIFGATPASFLAHNDNRGNSSEILTEINGLLADGKVDIAEGKVGDGLNTSVCNALNVISSDSSRYFMMVEEARIDKESHSNNIDGCKHTVKVFNEAIASAIQFTLMRSDTVLIITADHETGGLTKMDNGNFVYTSGDHTSANVPIYAIGAGTEIFNGAEVENVEIAKFIARIYGDNNFGQ